MIAGATKTLMLEIFLKFNLVLRYFENASFFSDTKKKKRAQREKLGHEINSKHRSIYMNMRKVNKYYQSYKKFSN